MNSLFMIGILDGDAELVYQGTNSKNNLYKFKLRVPKQTKNKTVSLEDDLIIVKIWATNLEDESMLHDQARIGLEGRIASSSGKDSKMLFNEIIAQKVYYLA